MRGPGGTPSTGRRSSAAVSAGAVWTSVVIWHLLAHSTPGRICTLVQYRRPSGCQAIVWAMPQISHREQLLEGAIECLRTKGYARTTARDIAAAANANLASIGYHFGSKEALLNEAITRTCDEWTTRLGQAAFASGNDSPLDQMGASWVAMLNSFQ